MSHKENIILGITLHVDRNSQLAYLTDASNTQLIEANIVSQKFNFNVPRGKEFSALFTGELSINLDSYPCEILDIDPTKIQAALNSIRPNQLNLFTKRGNTVAKLKIHQDENPAEGITVNGVKYQLFNPEAYEQVLKDGNKLLPPHLSSKNKKKWHKERRGYEAVHKYPSMFPGDKGQKGTDKTEEEIKEEIVKESKEYMDKQTKDTQKPTEEPTEETIDLSKDNEFPSTEEESEDEEWSVGADNKIGTLNNDWNNALFIGVKNSDNKFTAATTKEHPINRYKYVLAFDKRKTAEFFLDKVKTHSNLKEQIDGAQIYMVSEVLKPEQGTISCLWVKNAFTYLQSKASE